MITADELLHDPKYREMTADELKGIITGSSHPMNEYTELCKPLKKYGSDVTKALIQYYKDNPITPKQMKKSDIKHPMILIRRNGLKYCVVPNIENGWRAYNVKGNYLVEDNYTYDLLDRDGDRNFDIMSVLDWDGSILWERDEKKYLVGIVEESGVSSIEDIINLDKNTKKIMDIHPVSAEKAKRIKKIIEE